MTSTGSVFSSMLGVNGGRFDVPEVWDVSKYIDVAEALGALAGVGNQIEVDEARIQALEDKLEALDGDKATKFVAISPLHLKTDVFPNELYAAQPPPPTTANAIQLNGSDAYIEFASGRVDVLDFTKDWSAAISIRIQGSSVQGANLATFGTGTHSMCLKVQGPPHV